MHFRITAFALCLLGTGATAEEPPKPLKSLRAEMLVQIKSFEASKNPQDRGQDPHLNRLVYALIEESGQVRSNDFLLDTLAGIQKNSTSKELRDLCGKFAQAIQSHDARESEEFEKRVYAAVRNALEKGLATTSAKELDAPLADLAILSGEGMRFEERRTLKSIQPPKESADNILRAATFVLSTYQEGLLSKAEHPITLRESSPSQDLKTWISSKDFERRIPQDVMPLEELREKLNAALARISAGDVRSLTQEEYQKKVVELVGTVTKLEDMEGVLAKIAALRGGLNRGYSAEANILAEYHRMYRGLQSGTMTTLHISGIRARGDSSPAVAGLKHQLLHYGLAQMLKSSPALPQKEEESTEDFLRRVLNMACATHDWQMIPRVMTVASDLRLDSFVESKDRAGFGFVLAGVNMERAGIPAEAANNYLAALRLGSLLIPADYLRDRLKAIRQQFPDAFEGDIPESPTAPKEAH